MVNNGSFRSFQSHGGISIAEWLLLEISENKIEFMVPLFLETFIYLYIIYEYD